MALPNGLSARAFSESSCCSSQPPSAADSEEVEATRQQQQQQQQSSENRSRCCLFPRVSASALAATALGFATFSFCVGLFISSGIFVKELVKSFDQSAGTASLVASLADISWGLGALPVPSLHRRLGVPLTYAIGSTLVVMGMFLNSFATSIEYFLGVHGVIVAFGLTMMYVSQLQILYMYTPQKRRGLCVAIASSGGGAGAAWMGPVLSVSFERLGLHTTLRWFSLGLAVCMAGLVLSLFLLCRYGSQFKDPSTQESSRTGDQSRPKTTFRSWLRDFKFVTLYIAFALYTFGASVPSAHLPSFVEQQGISDAIAGSVVSAFGIANGVGRIIFPNLGDCLGGKYLQVFGLTVLVNGCSMLALPLCRSVAPLFGAASLLGLSFGGRAGVIVLVCCQLFGQDQATKAFSLLGTAFTITSPFGPPFAGFVHDNVGAYDVGFIVVGALMLISSILIGWLDIMANRQRRQQEDECEHGVQL